MVAGSVQRVEVADEWINQGAPLDLENFLYGGCIERIGGQAVDSFGGYRYQFTGAQQARAVLEVGGCGLKTDRVRAHASTKIKNPSPKRGRIVENLKGV